jgi:prepilin-type N-terminal cleavage/methylation domain-containing protein
MNSRQRHRGFTIIEVLATLALLVIFFDAAGKLFRSTILTGAACQQISNESARTDSAMYQLRRDVWNARRLDSAELGTIGITSTDGGNITWQFDADGTTRTAAGAAEHWPDTCRNCSVSVGERWVEIADASGSVRLTGPILLREP